MIEKNIDIYVKTLENCIGQIDIIAKNRRDDESLQGGLFFIRESLQNVIDNMQRKDN